MFIGYTLFFDVDINDQTKPKSSIGSLQCEVTCTNAGK